MSPDINSLSPSPSPSSTPLQTHRSFPAASPSPPASHTPPHSLAAAAALNAGMQTEESRRRSGSGSMRRDVDRARRRSSIRMNLNMNDPTLPAPGEMQMSPSARMHHERTPSLGELHQELEYEQEGQVNRLLNMIRQQQAQIQALQNTQQGGIPSASAVDDSTPTSERSFSLPQSTLAPQSNLPQVPSYIPQPRSRSPLPAYSGLSRHSSIADRSRGSSHAGSPAILPMPGLGQTEGSEWSLGSGATRDESAFYQAETQNLTRENQMLKLRIRELERQLSELNPTSPVTHSPAIASNLHTSPPVSRRGTLTEEEEASLN
ncbi:hypothetical protein GQ43DRAFT_466321 [Delitschia confertaspora ATCC 74209]|uniref:Uncharacterized protein n=1 Tax=Delitschia confertaspora ATCC 74209 TaxID=1513339 RepID=A0A9P4JE35_9PLEO|nr:hypothetical protein GQ43DRAFT_466321 [Delitschia confertaspora ATCC 74209]